ncbi:MAG: hypothetical protein JNL97_04430 [Verrucomicrobiales bacterium]|nr:hypothetical protein [Verrucomicrobiales bacterium]
MTPRFAIPSLRRHARPWLFGLVLAAHLAGSPSRAASPFSTNDVVAWVGGAGAVAADHGGWVETVLVLSHPGYRLRFRGVAWEGDTVFGQPRELNFPPPARVLRDVGATVACLQFGALEALDPEVDPTSFREAYRRLVGELRAVGPRLVLVVPPPFEPQSPPLPDYSDANERLARLAAEIRALAVASNLTTIDLHRAFLDRPPTSPWTFDGREPNPSGHRALAAAWLRQLDAPSLADRFASDAFWRRSDIAELHDAVARKNRLWFDAWRPMNWAFLAGDRTEQQASRDHRDPKIRWFPAEMEQFGPLVTEAEIRVESLARQTAIPR